MNVQSALIRNTAWYGLVTAIGVASGLIMSIILARGLGPAVMGDLSYVIWAERTLTALATLGYTFAVVRYTAEAFARGEEDRGWGVVRLFMRRQVLATTVVTVVMLPLVAAAAPPSVRAPLVVVVATLFLITIESIYSSALQGAQRYDITARTSTVKMILQLGVAALAVHYDADLVTLIAALGLTLVISCLVQRRRAHEVYKASRAIPPAPLTPDMRAFLLPLSIVAVLDTIVWDRSPVFFLGVYASSETIAYYSLAFGLANRIMIIPGIVVGALLPAFAALHGGGEAEEFARLYHTALRYVGLLGVPLAAVVSALAPGLITVLYGEAYLPAASLVGVLAATALLSALRAVVWAALRAVGDRRCALTATAVAAGLNVALAAVLIPRWPLAGAVIANTAGQLTASVWVFLGMSRTHGVGAPVRDFGRLTLAGVLTLGVTWIVAHGGHDVPRMILAALVGFLTFALAGIALRMVGAREWGFITVSTRRLLGTASPGATTSSLF